MHISALAPSRPSRRPFLARIWHVLAFQRSRRALGRLDDHLLRDIGLTPQDAQAEATRPIWDVPLHWRR